MTAISTFAKEDFIVMKYIVIFFSVIFSLASLGGLLVFISTKDIVILIMTFMFILIGVIPILLITKSKKIPQGDTQSMNVNADEYKIAKRNKTIKLLVCIIVFAMKIPKIVRMH